MFFPCRASAAARFTATVDLPTPPLALATARMAFMPGIGAIGVASAGLPWLRASSERRAPLRTRRVPAGGEGWRVIFAGSGAAGEACAPGARSAVSAILTAFIPLIARIWLSTSIRRASEACRLSGSALRIRFAVPSGVMRTSSNQSG